MKKKKETKITLEDLDQLKSLNVYKELAKHAPYDNLTQFTRTILNFENEESFKSGIERGKELKVDELRQAAEKLNDILGSQSIPPFGFRGRHIFPFGY